MVPDLHVAQNLKIEKDLHVSWFPEITFLSFAAKKIVSVNRPKSTAIQ